MVHPIPIVVPAISVAMATYNGARNLREQLDSLRRQTLLPAELVVCDDGSDDATIEILAQFAQAAPFPVLVRRNETRLGPAGNFFRAAQLCRHNYVAFCDQDDIWRPVKLAACRAAIERWSPDVLLHSYVSFRVDHHGRTLVEPHRSVLPNRVLPATDLEPTMIWLGMAMVVRRALVERVVDLGARWKAYRNALPQPEEGVWHDNWGDWHDVGCLIAALAGGNVATVNRILADHRTMDGGLFSDPAGQVNAFTPLLQHTQIRDTADKYHRLSLFYGRMADMFDLIGDDPAPTKYYRRWQDMARARSVVRDRSAPGKLRRTAWRQLFALQAYRSQWSGGEGLNNLKLDARAMLRSTPAA